MVSTIMVLCLLAACTDSNAANPSTTTSAESATTATSPPTTTPAVTSTTVRATTTTFEDVLVGDPEELQQAIDEARDFAVRDGELHYEGVTIPYPDLNNPNPLVALREALAFEAWLFEIGPYSAFVHAYNYPDSLRLGQIRSQFLGLDAQGVRFGHMVDTYEVFDSVIVSVDQVAMPDSARAGIPPGSVAVSYRDRGGPHEMIDLATGDVLKTIEAYEGSGTVILAPSELGWQIYWVDEVTA